MTQFFLDSADINEIEKWQAMGLVDGVTTNPALLAQINGSPLATIDRITGMVNGPVSVAVTETEPDAMFEQALRIAQIAPNITVKVPATRSGFALACALKQRGIKQNVTLNFHASQCIPFLRLNCELISVIVAKSEDYDMDNRRVVGQAKMLAERLNSSSQILAASIRHPGYLLDAVQQGADIVTIPPSTWEKIYHNPLILNAENEFHAAWTKLPDEFTRHF